jgi:U3 small nucleolar RNA-associated protein 12
MGEISLLLEREADCGESYEDGSIRIWDSRTDTVVISFNGHKSGITNLTFDESGVRLASGSKDTDIIVWDLIAEVGLYKLRGHKDQITSVQFLRVPSDDSVTNGHINGDDTYTNGAVSQENGPEFLLSTSKDALIKIWDLQSQHCIETHIAQSNGECWSLGLSPDQSGCVTAGNDGEVKVWSIDSSELRKVIQATNETRKSRILKDRGTFYRHGKDKTTGVSFHTNADYLALHGSEKAVEIWRMRSESEVQKSLARKLKRKREKDGPDSQTEKASESISPEDEVSQEIIASITDVFVPHVIVRTGGKVRSIDWAQRRAGKALQLLTSTTNNELEIYNIGIFEKKKPKSDQPIEYNCSYSVDLPGHRTDVRSLSLSSDDRILASASNGTLKIWNVRTQSCIRTLDCGYALCCSFLPGDKIVVVGNKNGELELFDIASSTLLDTVPAHEGAIWTLHVHPDGKSVVTGSADKSAKFWNFQVVHEEILGTKRTTPKLKLVQSRTLKLGDDILSLRFSPDSRLLAAALLDNTVKVFFADTLKLFLNLYGHKLPVLNMDISHDSKLIVTCSADKNVRLWGLDFGDCHKAFFAHQDSIMQVAFIPNNNEGNGHHFFSSSKDRTIKYWDGDKFEQIQKLEGHHGEIWAIAVSHSGEFLVSASHDKSIRIWEQTDEQLFLEEEREKELEELYENTLLTTLDPTDDADEDSKPEVTAAGERTVETLIAGERIAEALDIGMADLETMREWNEIKSSQPNLAPPARNPLFMALGNISAETHVLNVVQKVKAAALQDALLILPFEKVTSLFTFLNLWAEKGWNIPLTCRVLFFMLRTHHRQIVASKMMRPMLDGIRESLRRVLAKQKNEMGFNFAALKFMDVQLRDRESKDYVDETLLLEQKRTTKGKKRVFVNVS